MSRSSHRLSTHPDVLGPVTAAYASSRKLRIGSCIPTRSSTLSRDWVPALILMAGAHLSLGVVGSSWSSGTHTSLPSPSSQAFDVSLIELEEPVGLPPPPVPPSIVPPVPENDTAPAEPRARRVPTPSAKASPVATPTPSAPSETRAPPSAAASTMVASAPPEGSAVVDFTQGGAATFAGGITAAHGASSSRVGDHPRNPRAGTGGSSEVSAKRSKARGVRLRSRPECNQMWPARAQSLSNQSFVVRVRVEIRPDGQIARAWVDKDPGYGFKEAALACIREKRFEPALNSAGERVLSTSPPIEITFTRRRQGR